MLDEISKELDFTYEIEEAKKIGSVNKSCEWDGLIERMRNGEIDIGIGAISVLAEREAVIDFTVPFYDLVGISILMPVQETPENPFKFLTVLDLDVWFYIMGTFLITR